MGSADKVITIVLTGFGPFFNYTENPSWLAVEQCKALLAGSCHVNLITEELEVSYDAVKERVNDLWKQHEPTAMVHVGLSATLTRIELEEKAHNRSYTRPDVRGVCPPSGSCMSDKTCPSVRKSTLDLDGMVSSLCGSNIAVDVAVSLDAGRFLCEFLYYHSLHYTNGKSVFVHVPPLDRPFSLQQLAESIRLIVLRLVDQLRPELP